MNVTRIVFDDEKKGVKVIESIEKDARDVRISHIVDGFEIGFNAGKNRRLHTNCIDKSNNKCYLPNHITDVNESTTVFAQRG